MTTKHKATLKAAFIARILPLPRLRLVNAFPSKWIFKFPVTRLHGSCPVTRAKLGTTGPRFRANKEAINIYYFPICISALLSGALET